jgi:hypothetical protein
MTSICEERIWFAFEAPTFTLGFKCRLKAGHEGEHDCEGRQRQMGDATICNYTVRWKREPRKPTLGQRIDGKHSYEF